MYPRSRQFEYFPPTVEILTQPHVHGTRFRYAFEDRRGRPLSGNSPGADEESNDAVIRVRNYSGPLSIIVSCVDKNPPYRPHPHKIACGDIVYTNGTYTFQLPANPSKIILRHLNIRCVARKDMRESLLEKERVGVDPFQTGFVHKHDLKNIDLNCVRFCFEVVLITPQGRMKLNPVVSDEIINRKADPSLEIRWLNCNEAPATGGTEMCILCEKIPVKTDIEVRFYDRDGWEATGEIVPPGIFRQVAVVLRIPAYTNKSAFATGIEKVDVFVQLRRGSDGLVSDPFPFQFVLSASDDRAPSNYEDFGIKRKRASINPNKFKMAETLNSQLKSSFPVDPRIFDLNGHQSRNDMDKIMNAYCPPPCKQTLEQVPQSPSIRSVVGFPRKDTEPIQRMTSSQFNNAHMKQKTHERPVAQVLPSTHHNPNQDNAMRQGNNFSESHLPNYQMRADEWAGEPLVRPLGGMNRAMENPHPPIACLQEPRPEPTRSTPYAHLNNPPLAAKNEDLLDMASQNISSEINTSDLIPFQDTTNNSELINSVYYDLLTNRYCDGMTPGGFGTMNMMNIPLRPAMSNMRQVDANDFDEKLIDF